MLPIVPVPRTHCHTHTHTNDSKWIYWSSTYTRTKFTVGVEWMVDDHLDCDVCISLLLFHSSRNIRFYIFLWTAKSSIQRWVTIDNAVLHLFLARSIIHFYGLEYMGVLLLLFYRCCAWKLHFKFLRVSEETEKKTKKKENEQCSIFTWKSANGTASARAPDCTNDNNVQCTQTRSCTVDAI